MQLQTKNLRNCDENIANKDLIFKRIAIDKTDELTSELTNLKNQFLHLNNALRNPKGK